MAPKQYNSIAVALGYKELFGKQASWAKLHKLLDRFSLVEVLDVLSRLSAALSRVRPEEVPGVQDKVIAGLFGEPLGTEIRLRAGEVQTGLRADGHDGVCLLFSQLQVAALTKVAVRHMPISTGSTGQDLGHLGLALLMVSELIEAGPDSLLGVDPATEEGRERWHHYFVANGLFHHASNEMHSLARSFDLYFTDRPHLREHPDYVDLPGRLEASVGFSVREIWSVAFALVTHWHKITIEKVGDHPGAFDRDTYLSSRFDYSVEEVGSSSLPRPTCGNRCPYCTYTRRGLRFFCMSTFSCVRAVSHNSPRPSTRPGEPPDSGTRAIPESRSDPLGLRSGVRWHRTRRHSGIRLRSTSESGAVGASRWSEVPPWYYPYLNARAGSAGGSRNCAGGCGS